MRERAAAYCAACVIGSRHHLAEQALRAQHQDHQHRQEQDDVGEVGKHRLAEIVEKADQEAADQARRAGCRCRRGSRRSAPAAASRSRGRDRPRDRARPSPRRRPASAAPSANTSVNSCETFDADHAGDRRIVDAGADHGAEPWSSRPAARARWRSRRPTATITSRIDRKVQARHLHDAAQMIGRGRLPGIAGPQHQAEVADDEGASPSVSSTCGSCSPASRRSRKRSISPPITAMAAALDQRRDPEVDAAAQSSVTPK